MDDPVDLKTAIEQQHGGTATQKGSQAVTLKWHGAPVWDGVVWIFSLKGHPKTDTAYAWSIPIEGSANRRVYAVLGVGPISSPEAAVQAAIVAENMQKT